MLRFTTWLAVAALSAAALACNTGRHSSAGFRLPPSGDVERGKLAFVALQCNKCHQVSGLDLPKPTIEPPVPVVLGGETARQMTDGHLVSSIIYSSAHVAGHPKELITVSGGRSRMPEYAENISVQQLTDIVAFLQSRYTLREYSRNYPPYY
jgi:mono/diheme cytochrome c family protein